MSELEIIIEADVVPRGSVDLQALDAPAGAVGPRVEVDARGRVTYLEPASTPAAAALVPADEVDEEAPTAKPGEIAAADVAAAAAVASAAHPEPAAEAAEPAELAAEPAAEPEPVEVASANAEASDEAPTLGPLDTATATANLAARTAALDESRADDLAALSAAAEAPIPPRPASAESEPAPALLGPPHHGEFDTDLDSTSSFFQTAMYLGLLLLMPLGLWLLALYLTDRLPFQQAKQVATVTSPTPQASSSRVPVDVGTVPRESVSPDAQPSATPEASVEATPDPSPEATPEPTPVEPAPEPSPEATPEPSPEPSPEATPEPSPEATPKATPEPDPAELEAEREAKEQARLEELRKLAAATDVGGGVGNEEDEPGLLERLRDLREEAESHLEAGDPAAALRVLAALAQELPEDGHVHFLLGRAHTAAGDGSAARTSYERSTELTPQDPRPWNNLALLHLAEGERDEARRTLQQGLRAAPEDPNVLTNLANLDVARRPAQSHALYTKALAKDPNHEPARLGRAQARERLGDSQGATSDYERLVAYNGPLAPAALDGLGRLARRAGDPHMAVAFHQRALAGRDDPGFRANLGIALVETGQNEAAREQLEAAADARPDQVSTWQALGVVYARLGEKDRSQLTKAKQAYERAIKLDPEDWRSRFNYALLAERFGKFDVALRHYEIAFHLEPRAWAAAANMAKIYGDTGRGKKALELLDKALEASPQEPELHIQRGYLLAGEERTIEARTNLRKFLDLADPNDPRREQVRAALPEHASGS